jgi:hypothetical protein
VEPDQSVPVHAVPFQVPPDQDLPVASRVAIAAGLNAVPNMSCSPERTTPSIVRSSEPRDRSMDPLPVDAVFQATPAGVLVEKVFDRLSSPLPMASIGAPSRSTDPRKRAFS